MKYPEARVVCGDTGMLHKKFRKTRRKAEYCRWQCERGKYFPKEHTCHGRGRSFIVLGLPHRDRTSTGNTLNRMTCFFTFCSNSESYHRPHYVASPVRHAKRIFFTFCSHLGCSPPNFNVSIFTFPYATASTFELELYHNTLAFLVHRTSRNQV